jgi:hypothetical protein
MTSRLELCPDFEVPHHATQSITLSGGVNDGTRSAGLGDSVAAPLRRGAAVFHKLWAPLLLCCASAAHAQVIVAVPFAPAAIPVDHPVALLVLVLCISACLPWALRRLGVSATTLRAWGLGITALALGALLTFGDAVQAQLQEVQRSFTQSGGQTVAVPVQFTATAPDGNPSGFQPVVFTNQTSTSLRIASLTLPAWGTCFPAGLPASLPLSPARPDARCAVETTLAVQASCWVDVAQLCADAAAELQGHHPSNLQSDSVAVAAGTRVTGNVLSNDTDPDGPLLVASYAFGGSNYLAGSSASTVSGVGIFAMQSSGAFTFDAASPFSGSNPIVVSYKTQTGASSSLSIVVSASAVNQAPVATNDTATTSQDAAINIAVRANDTDGDGDALTVTAVTQAANGSVVIDAVTGNPLYTPNAGFSGSDSFTYTVSDGQGGTATATVDVTVNPAVNHPPVAVNDSFSIGTNQPLLLTGGILLGNDTDQDGDTLTLVSVQAAVNGTVANVGASVTFTPTANYEGAASFTYTISDGQGGSSTAIVMVTVGSASAPSVVVLKSLLALAHGTGGTSVKFPVTTALVDTDGSESLSIRISGVPTGLNFNAGVNLGGGVWQFAPADLANLMLNVPGSYTTSATNLTVQVTAKETNGGFTASIATVVMLKADYMTVNVTTEENGDYMGNFANEYIQGGNGANIINAGAGNNIVYGGGGNDVLSAAAGSDYLDGGFGNDTLDGGSGTDVLGGGPGNDTLQGGIAGENFVDVFVWNLGDQGAPGMPAVDKILNFATAAAGANGMGGDVLYLSDLLQGEGVGPNNDAGNLPDYLHFEISGLDTIVHISHTGGFSADAHGVGTPFNSSAETQTIKLMGIDLQAFYSGATTDSQIITQLLNNNKLIVD